MATAAKIQKLTNGTVHFLDSSDNILATLMERARVFRLELQDLIRVIDSSGTTYFVKSTEITDLILDPAPALPFSGTNQDLYRKMTEDFFVDVVSDTSDDDLNLSSVSGETVTDALNALSGGGGGNTVDETNIKIIATPTYTVLSTDYILWITVNCTITLPLIPTVAIAFPIRIFCRNVKVTVQRTAPDLINGAVNFKMKKYDQVTLRAGQANDWGIGD